MKKILLLILLIVVLAAIPVTIFLVRQRQQIASRAAPSTSLSLVPSTSSQGVGDTFNVNVNVNTGGNSVVSADVVLTYDPTILEATGVAMGDFLPSATEIQKSINSSTGKIIYSLYTQATNAKSGEGTLAIVSFRGKGGGVGSVTFDAQSAVGAVSEGQNVLISTSPGSYTISGGATASPTVTPTGTATASPTGTAKASPTGTANPNPTANLSFATGTATPTPTGTAVVSGALTINNVRSGSLTPTISGKAAPFATVTIALQSAVQTATVVADANGSWSWTPTSPLAVGSHTVTASSGGQTKTLSFSVGSTTPATGIAGPTIILSILGFAGILATFILAF